MNKEFTIASFYSFFEWIIWNTIDQIMQKLPSNSELFS